MKRGLNRSDRALLASAWREVSGTTEGRARKSSPPFSARYEGFCGRCGRAFEPGHMIHCHSDFDGVVHTGCVAPEVVVSTGQAHATPRSCDASAVAVRQPPLCPDCHMEHVGKCL